jgi:hypothetical protein
MPTLPRGLARESSSELKSIIFDGEQHSPMFNTKMTRTNAGSKFGSIIVARVASLKSADPGTGRRTPLEIFPTQELTWEELDGQIVGAATYTAGWNLGGINCSSGVLYLAPPECLAFSPHSDKPEQIAKNVLQIFRAYGTEHTRADEIPRDWLGLKDGDTVPKLVYVDDEPKTLKKVA